MAGVIFTENSGLNDPMIGKFEAPIKKVIENGVEAFQVKSQIKNIYFMDKSKNWAESYTTEGSLSNFKDVGENGAYPMATMYGGDPRIIIPSEWKNRFEVSRTLMEDAKFGKIKTLASQFTLSYNRTREMFAAGLLAGAIAAKAVIDGVSYDTTAADKLPMFHKAHTSVSKKGYTQSNCLKFAASDKLTTILDNAETVMQDFTDDDKNLLSVAPDTIVIPNDPTMKRAVFEAIGSDLDPNTSNNAWNYQCGLWNVLVWPYLPKTIAGGKYFFLMDSNFMQDYMCAPFVDRVALTVENGKDQNTDAAYWKGRARFGAGFNNWRGISIVGTGVDGTSIS